MSVIRYLFDENVDTTTPNWSVTFFVVMNAIAYLRRLDFIGI